MHRNPTFLDLSSLGSVLPAVGNNPRPSRFQRTQSPFRMRQSSNCHCPALPQISERALGTTHFKTSLSFCCMEGVLIALSYRRNNPCNALCLSCTTKTYTLHGSSWHSFFSLETKDSTALPLRLFSLNYHCCNLLSQALGNTVR